jgi:excisionase family DNA binding protein
MKARNNSGDTAHDIIAKLRRMPGLLTAREVAKVTHKHPETIYTMLRRKQIPAFRDGSRWKVDPNELADWLERRSTEVN